MTYSIASESLGGGVCFQACLLVCKGLGWTLVVISGTAHCADRDTVCLKVLTFLIKRRRKLWNDAYLRIAMVTASVGTLLYCHLTLRFY